MKSLIFLIAMAELLFGFEGLAAPLIPHGFTTDKSKSSPLVISIPIETQQQIQFGGVFNGSLIKAFCSSRINLKMNTRVITTKIEEEHYTFVPYSGSISRHNNKQYKVFCLFGWIKTKNIEYAWGDKYITKRFGSYYRIKSR